MRLVSIILLMVCMVSLLFGMIPGVSENDDGAVRLVCLNIGKADCSLLLYQDEAYLIDTGYEQTYAALETAVSQYGITHLNGVFLTHCHKDHEGGLIPLAQSDIQVDAWYAARIYYDVKAGKHTAVLAAAERGQEVTWLDAGDEIKAGSDASFTVLGPLSVNTDNENNNSLVMRFSSPQGSILFAGDMKEEEEYELLAAGVFSACDILKAGHHGDNKATTKELLSVVRPKAAVIFTSTQEEPDTPAASTIKRLDKVNCKVYVSQDWQDALLLTLKSGNVQAEDILWDGVPVMQKGVSLSIDMENDTLTIFNGGNEPLLLNGCVLYSSKGDDALSLPDAVVQPGQAYVIGSKATTGDMDCKWNVKRIWHQNKFDAAVLYDVYGRAIARTNNGLSE